MKWLLPFIALSCFAQEPPSEVLVLNAQKLPVSTSGGIETSIQDQTTKIGDIYFSQVISGSVTSTLTSATAIDDWSVEVSGSHGITNSEQLVMYDVVGTRLYIGNVLSVSNNTINLDTPINYAYPTNSTEIIRTTRALNVDGSSERQVFSISPPIGLEIDVTRILFSMVTTTQPDINMFGDIADGITRGVVLRSTNGENVNYFNVKTNGDLVTLMYDVSFYEAAKQGVYGLGGRMTFGGQSKHGAVIRLGQGESLDVIIQDDLTSLISFKMIATWHVVEN